MGLHIGEVAHFPDALDLFVDGVGIRRVALANGKTHEHHIRIHIVDAAHRHIRKGDAAARTQGNEGVIHGRLGGRRLAFRIRIAHDRGRGTACVAQGQRSSRGQLAGSISKSTDGIALKVRRNGTARPHRDKARFHGKALPLLVEGAVHDKVSSG